MEMKGILSDVNFMYSVEQVLRCLYVVEAAGRNLSFFDCQAIGLGATDAQFSMLSSPELFHCPDDSSKGHSINCRAIRRAWSLNMGMADMIYV